MIKRVVASCAVLSLGLTLLTACGFTASSTYVGGMGGYAKLPGEWKVFDALTMIRSQNPEGSVAEGLYLAGFTLGGTDPKQVMTGADTPSGILMSVPLAEDTNMIMDRNALVANLNELIAAGEVTTEEDFSPVEQDGGFAGERVLLNLKDPQGNDMRLLQLAVTDKERERIWVLALACSPACFQEQREIINEVAETWKVREEK